MFALIFAFPSLAPPSFAQESRRILMLHAFNYTFPATTITGDAARKRLLEQSRMRIEIDADFMDLARAADPGYEQRVVEFLRDKYSRRPPDLVMSLGSAALPFVVRNREAIAPGAPVVFTNVSPQNYTTVRPPPDVTGIITEFNLDKTLSLAERLQPRTSRLFVVAGSSAIDRLWHDVARNTIPNRDRAFETSYLFDLSYEQLMSELSRIPPDSIVVILTVFADSKGKSFVPAEVASALAAASPAPVYAPYDTYIGRGSVGGFVETFESVGSAAADMMLEILSGKDPTVLPPRTNPGQGYRVDLRAMQRWNLSESNLPPGTTVLFKAPSVWDQHHNFVLAMMGALALQSVFAGALLIQRRRRQHAEALLKESEERMTFAAASVNIALWQFDRATNQLWATEHCRNMFGLSADDPLSSGTLLAAIHPEDRDTAIAALRDIGVADHAAVHDVRVELSDGQIRWVRIRARAHMRDGTRDPLNGIFIDVTDQKHAEAETTLHRQEVAHLMRVSMLGELSGAIAHEINQPLTAIQSNAETGLDLLAETSPNIAEVREVLADIAHDNRRASEVISRLRKLMKKEQKVSEAININDLIHSTLALLHSELISRRINAELDLASDLPLTGGDPVQLQQVLLNVIMNGVDAMSGTPISRRRITVNTRISSPGNLEVSVRDQGPGIDAAEQAKVFQPFFTTKTQGLGLGLAICATIVEAHGGTIALANDDAGGAVVTVSLPAQTMLLAAK